MNIVEPIRDLNKFYEMQRMMIADGKIKECLAVMLMFNTNLRIGDSLLIKWKDVIDGEGMVVDNIIITEKKTSKHKWIPLTKQLKEVIQNYYIRYNPRRSSYLFRSLSNRRQRRNEPWHRSYVLVVMKKYAKKAGIKENIGTHSCRKTWGYHAYKNGIDIYEIMRMLNHSNVRQTEVYCGIDSDRIRENYETVSKLNMRATELMQIETLPDADIDIKIRKTRKR